MLALREFVNKSPEAKEIMTDFATRQRVRKGDPVCLCNLRLRLKAKGSRLIRKDIYRVVEELERLGYGRVIHNAFGTPRHFAPRKSIRDIGLDAIGYPELPLHFFAPTEIQKELSEQQSFPEAHDTAEEVAIKEVTIKPVSTYNSPSNSFASNKDNVVVFFDIKGRKCKAEVPYDTLPSFEKLIGY